MSEYEAQILIGIKNAKKVLHLVDMKFETNKFKEINFCFNNFSSDFKNKVQDVDYKKTCEAIYKNYDYDIKLYDNSVFQFTYDKDSDNEISNIRYAFYESPVCIKSYEEFLKDEIGYDYLLCGEEFYEEYEQYKSEASLKNTITPIRYDYSKTEYLPTKHAISHLHIGHDNDVRIPMSIVITPCEFVAFILRHTYYRIWKKRMDDEQFLSEYKDLKKCCRPVLDIYFGDDERKDFFIA